MVGGGRALSEISADNIYMLLWLPLGVQKNLHSYLEDMSPIREGVELDLPPAKKKSTKQFKLYL